MQTSNLVIMIATAAIALTLAVRRALLKRAARSPAERGERVLYRGGLKIVFGCGHEDHRLALIGRSRSASVERNIARPDQSLHNCHDCFLKTGIDRIASGVSSH